MDPTINKLLVVGARKGSLGHYVADIARAQHWDVRTAGISGEQFSMDVMSLESIDMVLEENGPFSDVVCTVGVNRPSDTGKPGIWGHYDLHLEQVQINAVAVMGLCNSWYTQMKDTSHTGHFVAVSSNSAHIARTGSLGYCMSKAALSMGIRCIARDSARSGEKLAFYAYEPGWLDGTNMSTEVLERIGESAPAHRIPSGEGINPISLAGMIVQNLGVSWNVMNGSLIRVDGGEQ